MKKFRYVRLAGVTFGKCQEKIRKWGRKKTGSYSLVREPENPYDRCAVSATADAAFICSLSGISIRLFFGDVGNDTSLCKNDTPQGPL
jgi:hypothetical protein